jgi:hypothetical protein
VVDPNRAVVSLNAVVAEVPTCAKLLDVFPQLTPAQRSIKYWLIVPPASVEAVHVRLICTDPAAAAVKLVGAVGVAVAAAILNAARPAPQLSVAPEPALAEVVPAVDWELSSAINLVLGAAGTLSSIV